MIRAILLILVFSGFQSFAQSSIESYFKRKLSSDQLNQDYEVFRIGLEKIHPGLYRYHSQHFMDSVFLQFSKGLDRQMDLLEFYRKICIVIAQIRCQHTVATPASNILIDIERDGRFLPFGTFWEFDPVATYLTYDFSHNGSLLPGTRIISINGISIEEIYNNLISNFPADGDNLTNKHARLMYGLELHMWYYLLIDHPDTFEVMLETPEKQIIEKKYRAVTVKELVENYKKYILQKDPALRDYFKYWKEWNKKNRSKPIRLELLSDNIALLTVQNFHSNKFQKVVDKAFKELYEKQIPNLIIDVRGNGGGSDIQGRYLFNYLIDKPTGYFDSLYTTTGIADTTFLFKHTDKNNEWYLENRQLVYQLKDGRFATKAEVNKGLLLQQPNKYNFSGSVYVIMNGRSASTTAEFTAAAHFNKLATFIGEESGGAYHGGNGGDFASLTLPNSRIVVQIPLSRYVMNSNETDYIRRGTIPDYEVNRSIEDVLNGRDPHLDFVIQLIEEE